MKGIEILGLVLGSNLVNTVVTHTLSKKTRKAKDTNINLEGSEKVMKFWENINVAQKEKIELVESQLKEAYELINTARHEIEQLKEENLLMQVCITDHDIDFSKWLQNLQKKRESNQKST